jgi:hypothetical protein
MTEQDNQPTEEVNPIDFIFNDLSDTEKSVLEGIKKKIDEKLEKLKESKFDELDSIDPDKDIDFSDEHPDIIHKKHITNSPHEITILVHAETSTIDDKGNLSEVVDLLDQYYHIPVKAKEDYKIYLDEFMKKFHTTLEDTCRDLNK